MDKSIPYYPIIMHRKKGFLIPNIDCPSAYHFSLYKNGDKKEWVDIAMSLGEFETYKDGIEYFNNHYMTCESDLKEIK